MVERDANDRPIRKSRRSFLDLKLMFNSEDVSDPEDDSDAEEGFIHGSIEEDDDNILKWTDAISAYHKQTQEEKINWSVFREICCVEFLANLQDCIPTYGLVCFCVRVSVCLVLS